VGLSTSKGFCYALQKPLLTIPTLELMASVIPSAADQLICPMIDARRMEVYTALYDAALKEIQPAQALILEPNCFDAVLQKQIVLYCGNGAMKFKSLCTHPNAQFLDITATAKNQIHLALQKFRNNDFADLAYQDPLYVKEFYTPVSPSY
jgi:tRNA threonylcarbamoyladenosine biosynthesis protein TsaB